MAARNLTAMMRRGLDEKTFSLLLMQPLRSPLIRYGLLGISDIVEGAERALL